MRFVRLLVNFEQILVRFVHLLVNLKQLLWYSNVLLVNKQFWRITITRG
ncbi:hypothetical protein [Peribacillus sp. NPDC060253]